MPDRRPPPLFLADDPALDFLNSRASPAGVAVEWLADGADLLGWLRAAGLVPAPDLDRLAATTPAAALDRAAAEARTLRAWLLGLVAAHAGEGRPPPAPADLVPLEARLARDRLRWSLAAAGKPGLRLVRDLADAEALLAPLAEAVARLVAERDLARVKRCEGRGCTLWFYDVSRAGARRWCSMALCGNRAKAAAHRARHAAGTGG
jgi:predicted RNA-binding Zn ribbon-like protein